MHTTFTLGIYDPDADSEFAAVLELEAPVCWLPPPGCDALVKLHNELDEAVVQAVALDLSDRRTTLAHVRLMIYADDVDGAVALLRELGWRLCSRQRFDPPPTEGTAP